MTVVIVDTLARRVGDTTGSVIGRRRGVRIHRLVAALPTNKSAPVRLRTARVFNDWLAYPLADADGNLIGSHAALWCHRIIYAQRRGPMAVCKRYTPEIMPGEICNIGMDFSAVIPPGVGIRRGTLQAWFNTLENQPSDDLATPDGGLGTPQPVKIHDRILYVQIQALFTAFGNDYQLEWTATDTDGNVWPRLALLLCSNTS